MRRIDTRTDQAVTDVVAGAKGCFHIGSVMRIDVDGIIKSLFFCNRGKSRYQVIIVRSAGIFGADGYHPLGTAKVGTDTAHIDGNHFFGVFCYETSTVSDFFVDGK